MTGERVAVEPVRCPACGGDHQPGRGRFDRQRREWTECWEMTEAAWALVKDRETPDRAKAWARGLVGLDTDRQVEAVA